VSEKERERERERETILLEGYNNQNIILKHKNVHTFWLIFEPFSVTQ